MQEVSSYVITLLVRIRPMQKHLKEKYGKKPKEETEDTNI
jgi:hypothetical protein